MIDTEDLDDIKCVEFIKKFLPQDLKDHFSDDELYYFLDLIDEYYVESGVLDSEPDEEGYVSIDLEKISEYIVKEAKKNNIGTFSVDDMFWVVQGEMEYGNSLGEVN